MMLSHSDFFHPDYLTLVFWLFVGHCLADYPLQGPFLSEAKNRNTEIGKVFWKHAMFAHVMIQGGFVAYFTGSIALGLLEALIHFFVDMWKCSNKLTVNQDQLIHLSCKLLWAAIIFLPPFSHFPR